MDTKTLIAVGTALLLFTGAAVCTASSTPLRTSPPAPASPEAPATTRSLVIEYRSHTGHMSQATVLLPGWYGAHRNPPLPLVISPHGRGLSGRTNALLWGDLPVRGGFVVVNPDGEGEHLSGRFSWGSPGEIDDLARMPQLVRHALPWLRLDPTRIYALGGSMGGQETLLLLGKHPGLLAGAVAVDPAVDFARRYRDFSADQRALAEREVGGTPSSTPALYAERSVLPYARSIALSGVPLQIWWSSADRIIIHSPLQSGLLVRRIRELNPHAALVVHTGTWVHTRPLRWDRQLPAMLAGLGLLDETDL